MADVEKINGYDIADATARSGLLNKQDIIQVSTMPTASADNLDKIVQYIGATSTYTNGYFYKCVSDGASTPTFSWAAINVQASTGSATWGQITGTLSNQTDLQTAIDARIEKRSSLTLYPTGQEEEHLGEIVQYIGQDYPLNGLYHGYFYQWTKTVYSSTSWSYGWKQWNVQPSSAANDATITITQSGITKGSFTTNQAIDATIDIDGGQIIQVSTMPTASADNVGKVVQWIGNTGTYTNGYFYKCVAVYTDLLQMVHVSSANTDYYIGVSEFLANSNLQTNTQYDLTYLRGYWEPTDTSQSSPAFSGTSGIIKNHGAVGNQNDRVILELGETYAWERIDVQPQGTSSVSTLTDVQLTNLSDGETLIYDANSSKWVNGTGGVSASYNSTTKTITFA